MTTTSMSEIAEKLRYRDSVSPSLLFFSDEGESQLGRTGNDYFDLHSSPLRMWKPAIQ